MLFLVYYLLVDFTFLRLCLFRIQIHFSLRDAYFVENIGCKVHYECIISIIYAAYNFPLSWSFK